MWNKITASYAAQDAEFEKFVPVWKRTSTPEYKGSAGGKKNPSLHIILH